MSHTRKPLWQMQGSLCSAENFTGEKLMNKSSHFLSINNILNHVPQYYNLNKTPPVIFSVGCSFDFNQQTSNKEYKHYLAFKKLLFLCKFKYMYYKKELLCY